MIIQWHNDLRGCIQVHTLVTLRLMFSSRCSCPLTKNGCWNSVSSRSGFNKPPCSMCTTLRKPSAQKSIHKTTNSTSSNKETAVCSICSYTDRNSILCEMSGFRPPNQNLLCVFKKISTALQKMKPDLGSVGDVVYTHTCWAVWWNWPCCCV